MGQRLTGSYPYIFFPKRTMDESDQADILSKKIANTLDWAREELDMTYISIVGVLETHKFLTLCELYAVANNEIEFDDDEEDEEDDWSEQEEGD